MICRGSRRRSACVGVFAREHGAKVPGRLVSSAKSWLSHAGVDRRAAILPWTAADDVTKISPVAASAAYLEHLRDAWNARIPGKTAADRLENQEVFLTVPASFDPVARELTMEAAGKAGLKHVTLLEEPQAAFYAWLAAQDQKWRKKVKVGDIILVCDVGGGTTDFTLIAVTDEGGDLALSRLAVGEHILLGGDNMDLALAYAVAATMPQGMEGLDAGQRVALGHACRNAKETLFTDLKKNAAPVAVLGRGSKVIGGSIKTELTRDLLKQVLLDGFLPACAPTDQPQKGRRVGLTEIGLPYAADPAITRHMARFLGQQAGSLHTGGSMVLPSAVLFNGGVFKAVELRRRILEVLSDWAGRPVPELESSDLDLAVAHGAAYYGQVRRGRGVRIKGGVGRSYYVGLETAAPAVPGVRAADQGPVRRSDGHGRRHRGQRARLRDRPDRGRAGPVPLPRLDHPPRRCRRHHARALEHRGASRARSSGDRARSRRRRLGRPGACPAALPNHRSRNARAFVPVHP